MRKVRLIVNGFVNLVRSWFGLVPLEKKRLYKERLAICKECKYGGKRVRCLACGCVIAAKTKSDDAECPIHNW